MATKMIEAKFRVSGETLGAMEGQIRDTLGLYPTDAPALPVGAVATLCGLEIHRDDGLPLGVYEEWIDGAWVRSAEYLRVETTLDLLHRMVRLRVMGPSIRRRS